MARTHPVSFAPTSAIFDPPGVVTCINQEWLPFLLGAAEVLAQKQYWLPGQEALTDQIDDLIKVWAGDVVDCTSIPVLFSCPFNLTVNDGGVAIYGGYGSYVVGSGWQTVNVGATDYVFLGGFAFSGATNLTRIEVVVDWLVLGGGASPDAIGLFHYNGGSSFTSLGPTLYPTSVGSATYAWSGTWTVDNVYINISGKQPGVAQITSVKFFGAGDNNIC